MKPEPYSCNICGMIFVNKKELAKHGALVHATNKDEKMFQCQSCSMFFSSIEDFERHAIEAHSKKSNYNIGKTTTGDVMEEGRAIANIEDKEYSNSNTENRLLKRVSSEEKAHKRTRGPYRKSSS
jgi:uncharacterized C2H2 Zn-finger protein